MYSVQFYNNPYTYPDYGNVTAVGSAFDITGVDIDDNRGIIKTDKLTFAQRFTVNYLKIIRDGVTLWAFITSIERLSGDKGVVISFQIDTFRTFRGSVDFGTQFVVRQPGASFDFDPLLRGASGELTEVTTTRYDLDNPNFRVLVVQIMRPDGDTTNYTSPVLPSPYIFYFKQYNINSPETDADIRELIKTITDSARPSNLAAIYSVPVFSSGGMTAVLGSLPLIIAGATVNVGSQFFRLTGGSWATAVRKFSDVFTFTDKTILRTPHAVSVVIPEAGIIQVPDEILFKPGLKIRQDIDIYTGASNYMLVHDDALITPYSVRSAGLAGVPIAYDVQQQAIASNRTGLATGILGDVASIGIGIAGIAGAGFTGGLTGVAGAGMIAKGALGIVGTLGGIGDSINQQVNPPSYLGSALSANFGQSAFLVVAKGRSDNASIVHGRYGYPCNQVQALTIPSSGYIQTQDCNVSGNIPTWARKEINQILDGGLRVI
jgi:hypothetical protein